MSQTLNKLHKTQLKSDRTSCSTASANQVRLILHTAAYWLLWTIRQATPEGAALKRAEFATPRNRLVKIGARVLETATRIRVAFASASHDKDLFAQTFRALNPGPTPPRKRHDRPPALKPLHPETKPENPTASAHQPAPRTHSCRRRPKHDACLVAALKPAPVNNPG